MRRKKLRLRRDRDFGETVSRQDQDVRKNASRPRL